MIWNTFVLSFPAFLFLNWKSNIHFIEVSWEINWLFLLSRIRVKWALTDYKCTKAGRFSSFWTFPHHHDAAFPHFLSTWESDAATKKGLQKDCRYHERLIYGVAGTSCLNTALVGKDASLELGATSFLSLALILHNFMPILIPRQTPGCFGMRGKEDSSRWWEAQVFQEVCEWANIACKFGGIWELLNPLQTEPRDAYLSLMLLKLIFMGVNFSCIGVIGA